MKNILQQIRSKTMFLLLSLSLLSFPVLAQDSDKIVVDKQEVGNWFQQNWMWVVGGVVLIILIAAMSSGRNKSRSTTVVKDMYGNTKRVTTTEIES